MDKYDFLRDRIESSYDRKTWLNIENTLREKCKRVFLMWLDIAKQNKLEDLSEMELESLLQEWVGSQRQESEYNKNWKGNQGTINCLSCVFGVKNAEQDAILCLQLAKVKPSGADCSDEMVNRGSEFFGELFEFLNMLRIYIVLDDNNPVKED